MVAPAQTSLAVTEHVGFLFTVSVPLQGTPDHPFRSVTTAEYVPPVLTVMDWLVAPPCSGPLHRYVYFVGSPPPAPPEGVTVRVAVLAPPLASNWQIVGLLMVHDGLGFTVSTPLQYD